LQRKRCRLFLHICTCVVCLSVVCYIRAPYLNCSTDFDVIWRVHLRGPMTQTESLTPRRGIRERAITNCSQTFSPMLSPNEYKQRRRGNCSCQDCFGFCLCVSCKTTKLFRYCHAMRQIHYEKIITKVASTKHRQRHLSTEFCCLFDEVADGQMSALLIGYLTKSEHAQ